MKRLFGFAVLILTAFTFTLSSCKTQSDDDTPASYTITIASTIEHGTVTANKTSTFKGDTVKLTVTPTTGYQFGSLTVTDANSSAVATTQDASDATKYTFTMPTSNVTISATFTAIPPATYTITFNANGGTITTTTQTVLANTATALTTASALGLSRDGYTFAGWGTASDATTATYADGASVTLTGALTLYAIWTVNTPAAKAAAEATVEDLGKMISADGKIYADADTATAAGTTTLAKIVYVGSDAETSTTFNHGLALALSDVTGKRWSSQDSNPCLTTLYSYGNHNNDMAGIANTDVLVSHTGHTHDAASAARGYNSGTHPTGTSEWFLPSAGQWNKMIGTGGYGVANLMTTAGGYTGLTSPEYWSSTEKDYDSECERPENAFYFYILNNSGDTFYSIKLGLKSVRACLAF